MPLSHPHVAPGKPFHVSRTSVHGSWFRRNVAPWDEGSGGDIEQAARGTHLPPPAGVFCGLASTRAKVSLRVMRRERYWIPSGSPQERSKSFHGGFRALAEDPSGLARAQDGVRSRDRDCGCVWLPVPESRPMSPTMVAGRQGRPQRGRGKSCKGLVASSPRQGIRESTVDHVPGNLQRSHQPLARFGNRPTQFPVP